LAVTEQVLVLEDDASLVLAVQAGDTEAYAELFRRHYPAVRRACARRLRDVCEADEVAQAAFVRALERIDRCGGERRFGAWVQVIAQRLCIDTIRAEARTTPSEDPLAGGERELGPNTPEDRALDADRAATLRAALSTLPPRQRDVVIARDLEDRRPPEIAAAFGLSIGAVDSLLLRARRRLAGAYRAAAGEQGITTAASSAAVAGGTVAAGNRGIVDGIAAGVRAVRDAIVNVPALATTPAAAPVATSPVARRTAAAALTAVIALTGLGAPSHDARTPLARPTVPAVDIPATPRLSVPPAPQTPTPPATPDLAGIVPSVSAPAVPVATLPPAPQASDAPAVTIPALPAIPVLPGLAVPPVAQTATDVVTAVAGVTSTLTDALAAGAPVAP
jgi:RNA polymerase sigma-70 factor (ECF subfamily)